MNIKSRKFKQFCLCLRDFLIKSLVEQNALRGLRCGGKRGIMGYDKMQEENFASVVLLSK